MAEFTPNFNLKKPNEYEFYNIEDFNGNMDIIDEVLKNAGQSEQLQTDVTEIKTDIGSPEDVSTSPTIFGKLADIKEMITSKLSEVVSKIIGIDSKIGTSLDIGTDTVFGKLNNTFTESSSIYVQHKILDNVNILFSLPTPSVNNYRSSVSLGTFYPPFSGACTIKIDIELKTHERTNVYLYEEPYCHLGQRNNGYDNITFCGKHTNRPKGTQNNISIYEDSQFMEIDQNYITSSDGQIKKTSLYFNIMKPKEYINDLIFGIENSNTTTGDYLKITDVSVRYNKVLWG